MPRIGKHAKTELLVGARRVRERVELEQWLEETGFLAGSGVKRTAPVFLIATSAGEVGIDLDADHMVCDLVAFERMVQRLGRVNRLGEGSAFIDVIAVPPLPPKASASDKNKQEYAREHAIFEARFSVLEELPSVADNRHDASPGAMVNLKERASEDTQLADRISLATTPEPLRPALTRALIDAWSMTSLKQHTGRPDIGPWLRGWVDDEPQTAVAWREFLPWRPSNQLPVAKEVNAFFGAAPVHLTETLEARTREVVDFLIARAVSVLETPRSSHDQESRESPHLTANSYAALILNRAGELRFKQGSGQGAALTIGQLARLGDKSTKKEKDELFSVLIGQQVVVSRALGGLSKAGLLGSKEDEPPETLDAGWADTELRAIGYRIFGAGEEDTDDWKTTYRFDLSGGEDKEASQHITVTVLRQKGATRKGDPAVSRKVQLLAEHHEWTGIAAGEIACAFDLSDSYLKMLNAAARMHDAGKDQKLWQDAMNAPKEGRPYAKTLGGGNVRLLAGYRHEFGSLGDANTNTEIQELPNDLRDLALHLIASHHGYARPVIPPIDPQAPPSVLAKRAQEATLRFTRLQRRWGPWGLAWWEAVFRAADWRASERLDAQPKMAVK